MGSAIRVSGLSRGRNSSGTRCSSHSAALSGWSTSAAAASHGRVRMVRMEEPMSGPSAWNCQ